MSYSYDPDEPNPLRREEDDEMFSRRERQDAGRASLVSEFVRKAIENTVGQAKTTGTLSKEALQFLLQQGDRGKREIVRIVAKEVGEFLRHVDLSSEVIKVLTSVQVEFQASVRFKKNAEGQLKLDIDPDSNISLAEKDMGARDPEGEPSSGSPPESPSAGASPASPGAKRDPHGASD